MNISKSALPILAMVCVALAAHLSMAPRAQAASVEPLTLGLPAIPPVFAAVMPYVAKEEGFYEKYGVNVRLREFDTGAAAARAIQAGDAHLSLAPTALLVKMISNAGVSFKGIYGMENPDWLLGSTDPNIKECRDVRGQQVGVGTVGGARAIALNSMIRSCELTLRDVSLVGLSSNVGAAMIAGQLKLGVLHIDDVPIIEEQLGRPLTKVIVQKDVVPVNHYLLLATTPAMLEQRRDDLVRILAAHIDATRFLYDPKNRDRVARIAAVTGREPQYARIALERYDELEFWPKGHSGLTAEKIEKVIQIQVKVGGVRPGKTPVTYDELVDPSLWQDALTLVEQSARND